MPGPLVSEILRIQHDAEQLVDTLTPLSPDHETVRRIEVRLQETCARLLEATQSTRELIESSVAPIELADRTLDNVRQLD